MKYHHEHLFITVSFTYDGGHCVVEIPGGDEGWADGVWISRPIMTQQTPTRLRHAHISVCLASGFILDSMIHIALVRDGVEHADWRGWAGTAETHFDYGVPGVAVCGPVIPPGVRLRVIVPPGSIREMYEGASGAKPVIDDEARWPWEQKIPDHDLDALVSLFNEAFDAGIDMPDRAREISDFLEKERDLRRAKSS